MSRIAILGHFVIRISAKGGARGLWRFPITARLGLHKYQASVRRERLERAIVTPKTRGARAARNARVIRHAKKKDSEWSGAAMVFGDTEQGKSGAMY